MYLTEAHEEFSFPPSMPHPRVLAHLGDAVYELHVREQALKAAQAAGTDQLDWLHRYTTERVAAPYQAALLEKLIPHLTEEEQALVKRARNLPVSPNKRSNQAIHRSATALEALVGALYLHNRNRLLFVVTL